MTELFSDMAEEKEVQKIIGKLKEARSVKSYYILEILSKFVSETFLLEMIKPLKEVCLISIFSLKISSIVNILLCVA